MVAHQGRSLAWGYAAEPFSDWYADALRPVSGYPVVNKELLQYLGWLVAQEFRPFDVPGDNIIRIKEPLIFFQTTGS